MEGRYRAYSEYKDSGVEWLGGTSVLNNNKLLVSETLAGSILN